MSTTALWHMRAFRKSSDPFSTCPLGIPRGFWVPARPDSRRADPLYSRGRYGEEFFTLSGSYFEGRPPKSVNLYWRRFRIDDIPLDSSDSFDRWLLQRWYEKDSLMETYATTGRFPPMVTAAGENKASEALEYVETEVRTKHWWEFLRIFIVVGVFALLGNIVAKIWHRLSHAVG